MKFKEGDLVSFFGGSGVVIERHTCNEDGEYFLPFWMVKTGSGIVSWPESDLTSMPCGTYNQTDVCMLEKEFKKLKTWRVKDVDNEYFVIMADNWEIRMPFLVFIKDDEIIAHFVRWANFIEIKDEEQS